MTAAEEAIAAQIAALAVYRTAVETADTAVEAMGVAGADIISAIRTKGRTGGATVYELAQIPAPSTPAPLGPPGTPTAFKCELGPDGELILTFRCPNPAGSHGTLYHFYRSATGEPGTYAFIGGTGDRKFTDSTVPSDTPIVYYKVQGIRTTAMGPTANFIVRFGVGTGGGLSVTTLAPTPAPKIAA